MQTGHKDVPSQVKNRAIRLTMCSNRSRRAASTSVASSADRNSMSHSSPGRSPCPLDRPNEFALTVAGSFTHVRSQRGKFLPRFRPPSRLPVQAEATPEERAGPDGPRIPSGREEGRGFQGRRTAARRTEGTETEKITHFLCTPTCSVR